MLALTSPPQGQLVEAFTGTPGADGAPAVGGGSKEVEKLIKNQLGGLMYNGVGLNAIMVHLETLSFDADVQQGGH